MPQYSERFLRFASASVWPVWRADVIKLLEENVSTQVVSLIIDLQLTNWKMVTPSGRLQSSRNRAACSKIYCKPAVSRGRLITSIKAWWRGNGKLFDGKSEDADQV